MIFRWLFDRFRRRGEGKTPAAAGPQRRAAPSGASPPSNEQSAFVDALKGLFAQHGEVLAGNLNLIGLDDIREQLGSKWLRLEDHVHSLTNRIIKRHLAKADIHMRYGELEYLIVFADLGQEAAQVKCAMISEELHAHLLGAEDLKHMRVRSVIGVVDDRLVIEEVSLEATLHKLAGKITKGGVTTIFDPPSSRGSSAGAAARRHSSERSRAAVKPPTTSRDAAAPEKAEPAQVCVSDDEVDVGPLIFVDKDVGAKPREDAVGDTSRGWSETIDFIYRPIWDVRHSVISTFMCAPCRFTALGYVHGGNVLPISASDDDIAQLDSWTLQKTVADMGELFQNRFQFLVIVPVHYTTVTSRATRKAHMRICGEIPEGMRKFLNFQIMNVPEGVPSTRLTEIASALQPFARALILMSGFQRRDFSLLRPSGIGAISLDISKERRSESEILADMNGFAKRAEEHGLICYVHGVRSSSLSIGAIAAGFHYIDGDRVKGVTEFPEHMFRYDWAQFYEEFLLTTA